MKPSAKAIAPIIVVMLSAALYGASILARPTPVPVEEASVAPMVEVLRAQTAPVQLRVDAQGTVAPRTQSELVTEVAGRIVWVSRELASGGFFDEGEPLVRVDTRDYEIALEGAQAQLARAESNLVHASAELARQRKMRDTGASSRSRLDDAIHQRANAEAGVREAHVAMRRAELDLERTEIVAPFAGRVREKHVDVGQYVGPGTKLARVYSVDYAEVRLPIDDSDLAYLDLPMRFRGKEPDSPVSDAEANDPEPENPMPTGPVVKLSASYGGKRHTWTGQVVRTEGALDERTRMVTVVVRVDDPYGAGPDATRPPLAIGLFVDAEIMGRVVEDVVELPRSALRPRNEVLIVDGEGRLRVRRVEVLRALGDRVWVRDGIAAGELVITSAIDVVIEGMKVRTTESRASDVSAAAFGSSGPGAS